MMRPDLELRWWLPEGADRPVRTMRNALSYSEKNRLAAHMDRGTNVSDVRAVDGRVFDPSKVPA